MNTATLEEILAALPAEECERVYKSLRYRWDGAWARPKQLPPDGDWDMWGLVAGRGGGKTRPGSQWTVDLAMKNPGAHMALVGRTARDTRETMVLGESGILACSPPWFRPRFYSQRAVVVFPNNFQAHMYSAEEPDVLRGHNSHFGWADEFAAWRKREAWTNLQDGLRLQPSTGRPRCLITTTPRKTPLFLDTVLGPRPKGGGLRPIPTAALKGRDEWEFTITTKDHFGKEQPKRTVVRRWRTEENAINLAAGFAAKRRGEYGDSAWGRMELDADIQEIVEGALWDLERSIDPHRVASMPQHHRRIVIVDPSHAEDGEHDAAGIIVMGLGMAPLNPKHPNENIVPHVYVMDDRTLHSSPRAWGQAAVKAYDDYRADLIVYESNRSPKKPDVVPDVIKSVDPRRRVKWYGVHSSSDKRTRADPVASMYEAGRVHHLEDPDGPKPGPLAQLEHEMVSWDPWDPKAKSPNRVDALVHGVTYLLLKGDSSPLPAPQSAGEQVNPWRVS